jgi:hypothetical protein
MRLALSRTVSHTSPCARPRASGCAASASALRRRSSGCALCGAARKFAETSRQRPCSTQETGDRQSRLRGSKDGDVEDPVLLRADELVAVVEEHVLLERVVEGELWHAPGDACLGDAQTS